MNDDTGRLLGPWAIALSAAILLPLAYFGAFHCDEANVFRFVTRFGVGDFRSPGRPGLLWLLLTPSLKLGPVGAALAMRMAAAGASIVTLWAVWRLGVRAAGAWAGTVAVALLGTSMSWQAHSFEVRTDTFVLPLTLLAMLLLWRKESRVREAVLIGLLVACAGLFSQKSIYNAAAMGAGWLVLFWLRQIPRRLGVAIVASAVALGCVAAWYGFLGSADSQAAFVEKNLSRAASNAFDDPRTLTQNLRAWRASARAAPVLYLGLIPGAWEAWRRRQENGQLLAMAAACLVMASTIFYHRGFYHYFLASFEPYIAVCSGAGWVALLRWLPVKRRVQYAVVLGLVIWVLIVSGTYLRAMRGTTNSGQVTLMRDVAAAFPQPTAYWDGIGLVPSYPETTKFLTGPNREGFRDSMGPNAFIQRARERKPLMFIRDYMTREKHLEADERLWIWTHFVPYRSNLYLRGGRVRSQVGDRQEATVEVAQSGEYTVYFWGGWSGSATVGGHPVQHGQTITLEEGEVELVANAESGRGQLWIIVGADREPHAETIDDVVDHSLYPMLSRKRFQQYDREGRTADLLTQPQDAFLAWLGADEIERRRTDHRTWQRAYDQRMATGQQQARLNARNWQNLSPEEREDRAMLEADALPNPIDATRSASPDRR